MRIDGTLAWRKGIMRRIARRSSGWRVTTGLVLTGALAFSIAPSSNAATALGINTSDRASVITAYQTWLEPLLAVPTGWNGSIEGCQPGQPSQQNQDAVLSSINYMRAMAGLPAVSLNASMSAKSQAAALIMAANGFLSHTPPQSATCWTKDGYDGASHGNLALGWGYSPDQLTKSTGPRAIVGYMEDDGDGNQLVGHRRWLLSQSLVEVGNGDTSTSNSVYVFGGKTRAPVNAWVSWPTAGFFPRELEPMGRWSLSHPKADFSRAQITVTTDSGKVNTLKYKPVKGFGDNTISWDMNLPDAARQAGAPDYPVTVTVSGIRLGGKKVSKTWTTTFVTASAASPVNP